MIVQVVLGLCCSQMSETILYDSAAVLGLCCSQMSDYRLYNCAGCSRALLFINVRLDCITVQVF